VSEPVALPSGRNLTVAIAPFDPANKLKKEIAAALVAVDLSGLNLGKLDMNLDLSKLDGPGLNAFKNVLLSLLASDRVEAAMFACAIRSTIDGEKVTKDSFEAKEARGDFVVVAWEVIRANAGSFFGGLDLSSFIPAKAPTSAPTS
jgi:hypothetical protein